MDVALKENLTEKLHEIIRDLSVESLAEITDFAEFLREKKIKKRDETKVKSERIAGLNQGEIWMSDDFNAELPDEFWFGEDGKIKRKNNESVD